MQIISHKSWRDFETLASSKSERPHFRPILYRGQSHSAWSLATTLERIEGVEYPTDQYYRDIQSAARMIETVIGKRWSPELEAKLSEDIHYVPRGYSFMAYLRQNGFPSPLLDWSRSPYVAAFFAFQKANPETSEHVAIFEYDEMPLGGKSGCSSEATIFPLGPWIATDRKHFLQQSEYTVCRKDKGHTLVYAKHEEAFGRNDEEQDLLLKHLIPARERPEVIKRLKLMNITAYSLFENNEGLMEHLANELFDNRFQHPAFPKTAPAETIIATTPCLTTPEVGTAQPK